MTGQMVSTFDEWVDYAAGAVYGRAQAVDDLADEIRTRIGANKHVPVYLSEHADYTGCADGCCNDTDHYMLIECGEHTRRLSMYQGTYVGRQYYDWLDEPARAAEREAAKKAEEAQQRERSAAFDQAVLRPITDVMQQVEAEGYANDSDWHDKLMDQLGVQGKRYRQ